MRGDIVNYATSADFHRTRREKAGKDLRRPQANLHSAFQSEAEHQTITMQVHRMDFCLL